MSLFKRVAAGIRVASSSSVKSNGSFDNRSYKGRDRTASQRSGDKRRRK
jgi:hypothetical protein